MIESSVSNFSAYCRYCHSDFSVAHDGRNDINKKHCLWSVAKNWKYSNFSKNINKKKKGALLSVFEYKQVWFHMHHFVMCVIHTICFSLLVFIYNSFFSFSYKVEWAYYTCTCMCVASRSRIETPERQHTHCRVWSHTDTHTHMHACHDTEAYSCADTHMHTCTCVCACVSACVHACVCVCLTSRFVFLLKW